MIPQAECSFFRQAAIFLTILFFFGTGAAKAQTAAGTITGIVRSANAVLPNLAVGVYPANDENTRLKGMRTDENGVFSFTGLAAGRYKIRFFTSGTDYIGGWYKKNNAPSLSSAVETFSEASDIILTATAGADVGATQLYPGLTITGKVTQTGTTPAVGIAGVYAQAYLDDGTTWVRSSAATPAEGTYTISGLRQGSYKIRFHAYETEYTTAWYSASATAEPTHTVASAADATLVTAGTTDSIDGQLSTGGSISGTVSKTDSMNTVPVKVAGALVVVYDSAEPYAFRGFITTRDDGTYTVPGIFVPAGGTGEYIVQFYEKYVNNIQSGLTEWYNDASAISAAAVVTITADSEGNKAASGIDAVLNRGPISGKVSYTTGAPVSGVTVKIADSNPEKTAVTDAKGLYSIPELSSSTLYTVQFSKNGVQLGEQTSVAAGATGINLQIAPPPPGKAAQLIPIYKRLLLKKRCYVINGVRVCR